MTTSVDDEVLGLAINTHLSNMAGWHIYLDWLKRNAAISETHNVAALGEKLGVRRNKSHCLRLSSSKMGDVCGMRHQQEISHASESNKWCCRQLR
jgi:hypothetical protein